MIVVKERCESEELLLFRRLNLRMALTGEDARYYSNLEKGYEGECKFDLLAEQHLSDDWLAVNDLLLEHNNRLFQIDSLLLRHGTIFVNDVKNFDGDFFMREDKWYTASGKEIDDPLDQLRKCESHLRRLLHDLGYSLPIESRLVFINHEFYLFQITPHLSIIYPAHLNRYMKRLKMKSGKLTDRDFKLAEKLASLHKKKSPFSRVPAYSYERLKKGIICVCHHSFMEVYSQETFICPECGCKENIESAVLRSVKELELLFPELKITTLVVHEWCKIITSKKKVWRILRKNFELRGKGKSSYYIKNKE